MTNLLRGVTVIEVTLGTNLVVCERPTFPVLHPLVDLTEDLPLARTLILAVGRFFMTNPREARYSGYARKHDAYDGAPGDTGPMFYAQIWHKGKVVRTAAFHLGYTGVLHIELPEDQKLKHALAFDMIGDMCNGHEALREDNIAERCIGYVGDGTFSLTVPQSYDAE